MIVQEANRVGADAVCLGSHGRSGLGRVLLGSVAAGLAPCVRWEPIDDASARATMTHAGITGSATFTFDAEGRMQVMTADRYMGDGASATLQRWYARASAWGRRDGLLMPVAGVGWKLETGDFEYYRWQLSGLEFDPMLPGIEP